MATSHILIYQIGKLVYLAKVVISVMTVHQAASGGSQSWHLLVLHILHLLIGLLCH